MSAERDIVFDSDGVQLAGLVELPDSEPRLGIVMIGGSGPSDRNNDAYFPLIRPGLVAAGIAALSYDKRGVGGSGGDWRAGSLDDLATDAIAAAERLRGEGVPTVGLFGHSEGGWVVLRAAARSRIPWVVTNSCPAMTPAEQDRFGLGSTLRAGGGTEAEISDVLATYDAVTAAGRRGAPFSEVRRLAEQAGVTDYFDDLDEPTWEFLKRKQDHDPLPDLRALRCPVLGLYGGADRLVPVAESIALFAEVACAPDRPAGATYDIAVFPGANHRVQDETGELAAGYLDRLISWVNTSAN